LEPHNEKPLPQASPYLLKILRKTGILPKIYLNTGLKKSGINYDFPYIKKAFYESN